MKNITNMACASIESNYYDIVVLPPPFKVEVMNDIVEDEATNYGKTVVDPWTLRQKYEYTKESWNIDISPDGKREVMSQEIEGMGARNPMGKNQRRAEYL